MLGLYGQIGHISLAAAWVTGDEVGDDLLVEVFLATDAVEDALELVELLERWFAHQSQHAVGGVFRGNLQASADMSLDEFAGVFHGSLVRFLVLAAMQEQVVAHTTANETFLDAGQGVDSAIYLKQFRVVGIQIRTNLRMDA